MTIGKIGRLHFSQSKVRTSTHTAKMRTSTHMAKIYSAASIKKWTITIDTKLGNRDNHDFGKGVMILLGYIPYVNT